MSKKKDEKPQLTKDEMMRRALFVPCETKQALWKWMKVFLDLDFPDSIVDPDSNCSPMDMVWISYDKMRRNDDPDFKRVLFYASREGGKTLAQAVIETLCLLHLERNVIHLAAIAQQSESAQGYVKNFLMRPYLRDFISGDNKKEVIIVRFCNRATNQNLTQDQFDELPPEQKIYFERIKNYTRIIVATVQSANGQHTPVLCLDGETLIQTKIAIPSKNGKGATRLRQAKTARGIFRALQGRDTGGRSGGRKGGNS